MEKLVFDIKSTIESAVQKIKNGWGSVDVIGGFRLSGTRDKNGEVKGYQVSWSVTTWTDGFDSLGVNHTNVECKGYAEICAELCEYLKYKMLEGIV